MLDVPAGPNIPKIVTVSVVLTAALTAVDVGLLGAKTSSLIAHISTISTAVGLFWLYFDKIGWRQKALRLGGWLCDHPDLNGRWVGTVERHGGPGGSHPFVLEIVQSYHSIIVKSYSANSQATSNVVTIVTDSKRSGFGLIYTWTSRTKKLSGEDEREDFVGTSVVRYSDDGVDQHLEDDYFTRRNPPTRGQVKVKRTASVLMHRFGLP